MFRRKKKVQPIYTKYPDCRASGVCEKCYTLPVPPWLSEEINHYEYSAIRNDIIMVLKRDFHPECAEKAIVAFDMKNGWKNDDC